MAKVRDLKKDVDYLVSAVVSDCYAYMYINGEKNKDKVLDIINSLVEKRNELYDRINTPTKKLDSKQVKAHYKSIQADLLTVVDNSFTKLSEVSSIKKK